MLSLLPSEAAAGELFLASPVCGLFLLSANFNAAPTVAGLAHFLNLLIFGGWSILMEDGLLEHSYLASSSDASASSINSLWVALLASNLTLDVSPQPSL